MSALIPSILKKRITFLRLPIKVCSGYKIYAVFKDDTYASGTRTELLEEIDNPVEPSPVIKKVKLEKVEEPTWKLPNDAYYDRDHKFFLIKDDRYLSTMVTSYNRVTRLMSIDTALEDYSIESEVYLEYYRDVITREYVTEDDCIIIVTPILKDSSIIGDHNVIL